MDLLFRTGHPRADTALETIVEAFEATFPQRARFVLLGSYATGRACDSSDLDLIVLFPDKLSDEQRAEADRLAAEIPREITIDADIAVCSVGDCPPVWAVGIGAGRTVFGDEIIRPLTPSIEDYTSALIEDVRALMQGLRPGQQLASPLGPPNSALPFLGYEAKPLRSSDGGWRPSTKALAMITFWGASALIARAGRFTASKDEVIETYRREIGDEWTDLIVDIDQVCRQENAYGIPTGEDGRARIRAVAERVLAFENHLFGALRLQTSQRDVSTSDPPPTV